jgi:hypothetical protein
LHARKGIVNVLRETVNIRVEIREVPNEKTGVPPKGRSRGESNDCGLPGNRLTKHQQFTIVVRLKSEERNEQAVPLNN